MNNNQTYLKTVKHTDKSKWYIIDAQEKTLGRISTIIANTLRGKNTLDYTPNINNKIYVIVINSKLVKVTGQKTLQKLYRRHSGRPGGLKTENFKDLQNRIPNRIIEKAVKGMLPKGTLGRKLFTQLKVYEETQHPHKAQEQNFITLL